MYALRLTILNEALLWEVGVDLDLVYNGEDLACCKKFFELRRGEIGDSCYRSVVFDEREMISTVPMSFVFPLTTSFSMAAQVTSYALVSGILSIGFDVDP